MKRCDNIHITGTCHSRELLNSQTTTRRIHGNASDSPVTRTCKKMKQSPEQNTYLNEINLNVKCCDLKACFEFSQH